MFRPNWFFAYPLDAAFVLELPAAPKHFRLYHPDDVHMTLAFLGGSGEEAALRALAVLDAELARGSASALEISLGPVVPMGSPRRYSALSALLDRGRESAVESLLALGGALLEAAKGARDERAPQPHVTLARARSRAGDADRQAGIAWGRELDLRHVSAKLDRIALYTWSENRQERLFRIVAERKLPG